MSDDLINRLRDIQGQAGLFASAAADRIEELEARLEKATPNDGRPCNTDEFLVVLLNEVEDKWDILDAIKSWIEGAWDEAVEGTTLAELTGGKDE